MKNVLLIGLLAFFHLCTTTTIAVNRGYVFTIPKVITSGTVEMGCLSLHNLEAPVHILLELLALEKQADGELLRSYDFVLMNDVEKCFELYIPYTTHTQGKLRLKMKFDNYIGYTVNAEAIVRIELDKLITFVETDKRVYKPGQDVNIRIVMLHYDWKPITRAIPKIWIENPSEMRVAQWIDEIPQSGIVQLTFPLSAEPSLGIWKIKVEKIINTEYIQAATFEVKKYVLPKFQVTIKSPGYILADAKSVTWNICVKYSYGKAVRGTLRLKTIPQTPSWKRKQNIPELNIEENYNSFDGCTTFEVVASDLGLADWKVAPNNIMVMANFTEEGTGVTETAISETVVVHQALKLVFIHYTPKYFKLGLPYYGRLRVLHQDDSAAPNEQIQLCLKVKSKDKWLRVVVECRNFNSSSDGFIDFVVPPQNKNIVLLSFTATGIDYPTKYYSPDRRWRVFMDQPSAYIDIIPWYSPSDSYLEVARVYKPIVCGETYSFDIMYTLPSSSYNSEPISFQYSINSKGDLLNFAHVKHKVHKESVLNYSKLPNLLGAVETLANKTDENYVIHKFPLDVKITPSMSPVAQLLLYYVRQDGEIVATTYTIEVGYCFKNKVKTAWHTDSQRPGTMAKFHVEAAPLSYCGISAVDKSTLFLEQTETNLIGTEQAFNQLKRFQIDSEAYPIQDFGTHCNNITKLNGNATVINYLPSPAVEESPVGNLRRRKRRKRSFLHYTFDYVDAIKAFDTFGTIVMSDLILETRPCPQIPSWLTIARRTYYPAEEDYHSMFMSAMPLAFPRLNFNVAHSRLPNRMSNEEIDYIDQLSDQSATIRSYFPETWLWELVPVGKEGNITLERSLPHTITDWVGHAVCVSLEDGLGIASPTTITAFQPFFLDYSLPYSVKRGEILHMKVSVFNYLQHSLPVKIKLEDAQGFDLQTSRAIMSYCIERGSSVVHEYVMIPRVLGDVNITVSAEIDPEFEEPCGPEIVIYTRDVIVKPILVQPEGFPIEVTKSAFICPNNFNDDSTLLWNLVLPNDLVPDSARAYVSLIGDILGPALENLENLVQLPMGCGEQNMILFVPNIQVIGYLEAMKMQNDDVNARAIVNMEKGYQRELNYRHSDGSYSAFGSSSSETEGSMWLTAFVVKSFAQARNLIYIDEHDLTLSVKWIVKRQLENGCFPLIGKVFHKSMKGGLEENGSPSALTAYVLISLLTSATPLKASLINNVLYCLEKEMANNNSNTYTVALSTYALALLEHPKANASLQTLMARATRHKDLLWWEDEAKISTGLSVEMTAYAILSLLKLGGEINMLEALRAVRWISKQRNVKGGFTSTQDTIIGLEALTKYAAAVSKNYTDLTVNVTANEIKHVYGVNSENQLVLNQFRLSKLPATIQVIAEGKGCVLVQSNLKYNIANAKGSQAFDLSVATESVASGERCSKLKITICSRYKLADEESNMALLEIGMISGYAPDRTSLHALLEEPSNQVKRFEDERDVVTMYFDKLTGQRTCVSFLVTRENLVDKSEPANVRLYDYYQQELTVSTSYSFAQTCSSNDDDDDDDAEPDKILSKREPAFGIQNWLVQRPTSRGTSKNTGKNDTGSRNKAEAMTNVRNDTSAVLEDPGSGQVPDEPDFGLNPAFVDVDHDLNTPTGVEGPPPTFVKPTYDIICPFTETEDNEKKRLEHHQNKTLYSKEESKKSKDKMIREQPEQFVSNENLHSTPAAQQSLSCPICVDKLPLNINSSIYCSALSIVKVMVREQRRVRLLLDLQATHPPTQLGFTIQLYLNPNCSCSPLDIVGDFALLMDSEREDRFAGFPGYVKRIVNRSVSVYPLGNMPDDVPAQIIEARSLCDLHSKIESTSSYESTTLGH